MSRSGASRGLDEREGPAVTQEPPVSKNRSVHWTALQVAIALACLIGAVFFPIGGFEFVDYDVTGQVVENPWIRGLTWENVQHIFTSRCVTSYYPVRTLSFALDYQLWELWPGGFKLTNGLIHLANVLLVFWLILRLIAYPATDSPKTAQTRYDVFLAGFCAGIFAVHPIVVEPVAWVAGREELLMTLGALACFHLHLAARRLDSESGRRVRSVICDLLAAICCVAACLSNAVGAVIPLMVTVWDVLMLDRPKLWRIFRGTSALWVASVATIAIKRIGDPGVAAAEPDFFSAERLYVVAKVYWLNLQSIAWPTDLAACRRRIELGSFLDLPFILGVVLIVLTGVLVWSLRRRKLVLMGLLWFGIALAPASQIMVHHIHRADRFLYLPLAGLAIAVAMGLRPMERYLKTPVLRIGAPALAVWSLLLLGILAAGQVQTWRNSISMWKNCVRIDPDNALARHVLGYNLAYRGQYDEAMEHREAQLSLDFNNPEAMRFAALLAVKGTETQPSNCALAVQLARRACELTRWDNPRHLDVLAVAYSSLGQSQVDDQHLQRAIQSYRTALEVDSDCRQALVQLAVVLATCSDERFRKPQEAVALVERAAKSVDHADPNMLVILATVYAEAWEFDKAIATTEKAIQLAQSGGQAQLVEPLRQRLEQYRKRIPPETLR